MKPLLSVIGMFALAGCTTGGPSDPCSAVVKADLEAIFGAPVTSMEKASIRSDSQEREGSCDIDFADSQWLSLTLSERSEAISAEMQATFGLPNSDLTSRFGFPVIHTPGSKELTAFINPTKRIYLRTGQNPGGGLAGSTPTAVDSKLSAVLEKLAGN